jgi:hypothetical protein
MTPSCPLPELVKVVGFKEGLQQLYMLLSIDIDTFPVAPFAKLTLYVKIARLVTLGSTVCAPLMVSEKSGGTPVPVRRVVCGLLGALSVTLSAPVRVPVVVGRKLTLMVQLPLTPREAGQLFVWLKSPLVVTLLTVMVAEPQLVSVTPWAALVVFTV